MNKLSLITALIIISSVVTMSCFASESGKMLGTVMRTEENLILDGEKDEVYAQALYVNGGLSQEGDAVLGAADYWLIYDKNALWVYCEITDSTLVTEPADPLYPNYKVDSIEVMIDFTNKGENEPELSPYQCRIDYLGNISARIGQAGTSLYLRESEGGNVNFYDAAVKRTDNGFNAEYRIPFPEAPKEGSNIGINLCYNDWDENDGTRVIMGSTEGVVSWAPDLYDYVTLGGLLVVSEPETAASETPAPVAAASEPSTEPAPAAETAPIAETAAPVAAPVPAAAAPAAQTYDVISITIIAAIAALGCAVMFGNKK